MKLNEKIMKLRKEKGLSQEEFGNQINVSRQAVSKWEAEHTKPDIDKLKEIAKFFDVSYEYLLNDEIENDNERKETKIKNKGNTKKIIIRMVFILLSIYLIFSLYKFIVLFRFYKIADSFSESNYSMFYTSKLNGKEEMDTFVKKIGSKIIIETSNPYAGEDVILSEEGSVIPFDIEYIDQEKEICYRLLYDSETNMYDYLNSIREYTTKEEKLSLLEIDNNLIKDHTLSLIPSSFKGILSASLNPLYQVSLSRREIYVNYFNRLKMRVTLTNDYLVEDYILETEFDGGVRLHYSYNYVQDHFKDMEIQNPIEVYKDIIQNYDEILK